MALIRLVAPERVFSDLASMVAYPNFQVQDKVILLGSGGGDFTFTTTASVVDNGTVFAVPGGYLLRKFVGPAYSSWFSNWAGIVTFMSSPNRHLVVDTVLQATSVLNIKSNSTLEFTDTGRILPDAAVARQVLNIIGSAPSVFVPLAADAAAGSKVITVAAGALSVVKGMYLYLRSNKLCDGGPNTYGVKISQIRKVVGVSTAGGVTSIRLDKALHYNYYLSDAAEVGIPTMVENVTLVSPYINEFGYDDLNRFFTIGISANFAADLHIQDGVIIGNKRPGASDIEGRSAIKFNNCVDSTVKGTCFYNIGWYGVEVLGCSEDTEVHDIHAMDVRHAISLNWQSTADGDKWGEPIEFLGVNCEAYNTTQAGFDTHDIGKRVKFVRCVSYDSADDGFQARTNGVEYLNCRAYRAAMDGFASNTGVAFPIYRECLAYDNVRSGFNCSYGGGYVYDCEAHGSQNGVRINGGRVKGGRYTRNSSSHIFVTKDVAETAQTSLEIDGVSMRYDGTGRAVYFHGTTGIDPTLVSMSNNDMTGHGLFWALLSGYTVQPTPPRMSRNLLDDTGIRGVATLVAGEATVNARVRGNFGSVANSFKWVSEVKLTRLTFPSSAGALTVTSVAQNQDVPTPNPDLNSFVIRSSNAADVSQVAWEVYL